jgi:hypothetical protein
MAVCNTTQKVRFQLRRATVAQWTTSNPVLLAGEPALSSDTNQLKIGDGVTQWANLPYINVQGIAGQVGTPTTLLPAATLVPAAKVDTYITTTLTSPIVQNQVIIFTANMPDSGLGGNIIANTLYYAFENYSAGVGIYIRVKTSVASNTAF